MEVKLVEPADCTAEKWWLGLRKGHMCQTPCSAVAQCVELVVSTIILVVSHNVLFYGRYSRPQASSQGHQGETSDYIQEGLNDRLLVRRRYASCALADHDTPQDRTNKAPENGGHLYRSTGQTSGFLLPWRGVSCLVVS